MRNTIQFTTHQREELIDITDEVQGHVRNSGIRNGIVTLYAQGATGAIMIQENWDASVPTDVVNFLRKLISRGQWLHVRQDNNGDAHPKAGLVGPSETIPLIDGELGLSRRQRNICFCEFDGPRSRGSVVCTLMGEI